MVPRATDDRGGVSCPDTADTSAMRRAYTLLERIEKPLPQGGAQLSSRRRAHAKVYYLFISMIAEPTR
jgi:hypothetical protein